MNPPRPAALARLAAALLLVAAATTAQTLRYDGWDEIRDDTWVYDPDDRPSLGFVVRNTSAARNALDDALERLADGDAEAAAREFVEIVEQFGDHVIQVDEDRWVGAGELALYMLETALPAAAVAQLDDHAQRDAVAEAVAWRDVAALRGLARRWEGQPAGRDATIAIARLLAERGEVEAALMAAERAMQLTVGDDDTRLADLASSLRAKLAPPAARDEASGAPTDLTSRWRQELTTSSLPRLTNGERDENVFHRMPIDGEAPYAPILPVVRDGVVYVSDTVSVSALNLFSGRVVWRHAGPLERATTEAGYGDGFFTYDVYAHHQRTRAIAPTQLAQPVVTDRVVFATEQALEPERPTQTFDSVPINWPLPRRRIVALDRFTGEELWRQERPILGPDAFVNSFDVHGPVVASGGVVYASGSVTEGSINAYVAAFDDETGELLWRTFVCLGQQDLTMFNRPFQEHVTSPPLLHDGSLYLSTNLGVVACIDAWSGRMRWIASYAQTSRRPSRSHMQNLLRPIYWTNLVPQMGDDTLVIAPLDAQHLLGLDPQTGRPKWAPMRAVPARRGGAYRHQPLVLSSDGLDTLDRLIVVGEDTVEMFDVRTGVPVRAELFASSSEVVDMVTGPAVLSGRTLLLPTRSTLKSVDVDRWTVSPAEVEWPDMGYGRRVRRLVPSGLVTLYTDHHDLVASLDDARVEARLVDQARTSPAALVTLGEVRLGADRHDEAIESFRAALDDPRLPAAQAEQARGGWLAAALGAARFDQSAGAWNELLDVARSQGRLSDFAGEALAALSALGATSLVDRWVDTLFDELPTTGGEVAAQRDMLELLVSLDSPRFDDRKAALARSLGEATFADALEGREVDRAPRATPRLPGRDAEVVSLSIESSSRLYIPRIAGSMSPELRHLSIASVHGQGILLGLDVARGTIAWQARMPSGVLSVNTSAVRFTAWDDRLVIKTRDEVAVLDLATGAQLWSAQFDDDIPTDVLVRSGLVLTLVERDDRSGVFSVVGYGVETGVRVMSVDIEGTSDAQMFTAGDRVLVLRRVARPSIVDPVRHMLEIDALRGGILHDTPLPRELEVLGDPIHERESVLFRHTTGGDVRISSWSAATRMIEWSRALPVGSSVVPVPGGERVTLITTAVDTRTGERHDVPVSVDLASGNERSADGGGLWHALLNDSDLPADRLVMQSEDGRTLRVMDARTIDDITWIEREERMTGSIDIVHGLGGFAVANTRRDLRTNDRSLEVFVVASDAPEDQRSFTFDEEVHMHQVSLDLVDGALVVAASDTLWLVRDPSLVTTPGDQR